MVMAPIDLKPKTLPKKPADPQVVDALQFGHKDQDNDGALSRDEFVGSAKGLSRLGQELKFRRYDRDGDGEVSKKEFFKGRAFERLIGKAGGPIMFEPKVLMEQAQGFFNRLKNLF